MAACSSRRSQPPTSSADSVSPSAALSSVSVQPPPARAIDFVALGAGAESLPS
jgi:hypothetical protein